MKIKRHRAAIRRSSGSTPIQWLLASDYVAADTTVLDYGCGHGDDVALLKSSGVDAVGWDPYYAPENEKRPSQVVSLAFVLNVIENPSERAAVLRDAWALTERLLLVTVRTKSDEPPNPGQALGDGYVTSRGTFQKYFAPGELQETAREALSVRGVPLSPGLLALFRHDEDRQSCAARQFRRIRRARESSGLAVALYREHETLFAPVLDFMLRRGRLPGKGELEEGDELTSVVGSPRRIRRILYETVGEEWLRSVEREAAEDLLVFLALEAFRGRPRFSELHDALQVDVRVHFGTYRRACVDADKLLMSLGNPLVLDSACRDAEVGKLTPSALYVHRSELPGLEGVLRVYEGCARAMLGDIDGANIVKFHRRSPGVSYLSYPDFDTVAHPTLQSSYFVDLRHLTATFEDFSRRENPPVLHRKETLVGESYALRAQFAALTRREEQRGLLDDSTRIGTRDGWEEALREASVEIRGHRIYRRKPE